MITTDFALRITGQPKNYKVHLEVDGEAESIEGLRERLRPLLGNIRLTTAEVDADLASSGAYEARSLPTAAEA